MLLGELKAGQDAVRVSMGALTDSTDALHKKVNGLPCVAHGQDIETLIGWKKECNGNREATRLEQLKGGISLKNAIIGGVTIALVSNIPSIILMCTELAKR